MAEINKTDIQFKSSQRLDDTDQGGGQMVSTVIVSGAVNNLFPDISRLDRVYGRVSLRKGYIAVNTNSRVTYYGAHAVLTQQTEDPNVSVCFFSSKDWFDTRDGARDRIEAYLVKGPQYMAALWGNHYTGTKNLSLFTHIDSPPPVIGDVVVLVDDEGLSTEKKQYLRITDVSAEIREFISVVNNGVLYKKLILFLTTGDQLQYDFPGAEIEQVVQFTAIQTKVYTTVAADASRYYGISPLAENAAADELHVRVNSIFAPLVPSAQSETAITDAGVGVTVTPILQTNLAQTSVTRSISYDIRSNSKLFLGEAILPGTFSWTGGIPLTDDGTGNILSGGAVVGSIEYANGTITFGNPAGSYVGASGSATYIPACAPTAVSETGGIFVKSSNRGFTYVYNCAPLPKKGTLRVDYLSAGKWYTLKDIGNGQLKGYDSSLGSGVVNFLTGSVSVTLGSLPDVDSYILLFWAKDAPYYDLSGETLGIKYSFTLDHEAITRGTVKITWGSTTQYILDNGNGKLVYATNETTPTAEVIGTIKYATGEVSFGLGASHTVPLSTENFRIRYSYGDKYRETFNPIRNPNGTVTFFLTNIPIKPSTFKVEWHTDQIEYYSATQITMISPVRTDPTHIFQDNGAGGFLNEDPTEFSTYIPSSINYTTGEVTIMPDRKGVFPIPVYKWLNLRITDMTATDAQGNPTNISQRMYGFDRIAYFDAASLWPTDGQFICDYTTTDGTNLVDYTVNLEKFFYIKADSNLEIVPGSLSIFAGTTYIIDAGNGKLYKSISGTTGIGTEVGSVNYATREVKLTDNAITNRTISIKSCTGSIAIDPVQVMIFRCPASPIRNASFGIRATINDGTVISGTSNFDGKIDGTYVKGSIDYNTGIVRVAFGKWVLDDAAAQAEDWYVGSPTDGAGNVWKPASVRASSVLINCVVTSYISLDSDLLGLNPVRLPLDGRVPIFRDGYIVLVHNTQNEKITISGAGALPAISRHPVNLIEIYDDNGKFWPDAGNYTVDLNTGVITILPTYSLPPYVFATGEGYKLPMRALHRIEDMSLASDVQITGHIALTSRLTHSYPKDVSFVSSVLPIGDLQSRAYNEFEQAIWNNIWSDDLSGNQPLSSYNFIDFPITVINSTCTKERWLLLFTGVSTIKIVGENLGVLAEGISILTGNYSPIDGKWLGDSGFTGGYIAVKNRNFGNMPYWVINCAGFGSGWSSNNCIRFNTDAANFPLWVVRTTLQAPPTEATDSYIMQIRGDSA